MTSTENLLVRDIPLLMTELDLPRNLIWFNELNAEERLDFFAGLIEVLASNGPDSLAALDEYLQGWQATVEICSSPDLLASYERAKDDLRHGRFLTYEEVFGEV